MKKLMLMSFALGVIFCFNRTLVYADEGEVLSYTEVVNVDGATSEELYLRAKLWFVDSFVDSKNVLEVEDKDAGILVGKGTFTYEPNVFMSSKLIRGEIRFTVKVMVKDGRYKYLFLEFTHQGSPSSSWPVPINFGKLTNANVCPKIEGTSKGMRNKLWPHMKQVSEQGTIKLVDSLKKRMAEPMGGDEGW